MSLNNFPMINQLREPTMDGAPDENAQNNCVAASLSAALEYLTGRAYDGDELKDAVYGAGYTGPMAIGQFAAYCARAGIQLSAVDGAPTSLIAAIHAGISDGIPVLATIPSQWGAEPPPTSGSTHVVCFYGAGAGALTAMNPWGGFAQSQPDSWWEARLRFGQVWRVSKMSGVPSGWHDDGNTLTAPNGQPVVLGFRQHILNENWPAALVPVAPEGNSEQDFSLHLAFNSATNTVEEQDGRWPSPQPPVPAHDPADLALIGQLQAQVSDLQAQIAASGGSGSVEAMAAIRAMRLAFQDVK